ncbi:MAG TPA: type I phosphomannose isomerase catalytic subunit [Chlamydiales bacterium]|nr:type I phosphomannose isomerase catalytic subunit [Chlamydiales bacterium]
MKLKKESPLYFHPISKEYIWGSESWLLSDQSIIANGEHQGKALKDLIHFPLLLKLIDAKENLSIQVHPEEKNEMWYFLKPGSAYAGIKETMTNAACEKCLKKNQLKSVLNTFSLQADDSLYIPAGTVHSLLAGCYLLEVQQNCNITYRLYDWERSRELHIQEALKLMHYHPTVEGILPPRPLKQGNGFSWEQILTTPHFTIERISTSIPWNHQSSSFEVFFLLQGEASISLDQSREKLDHRRACLCFQGEISITPKNPCQFLRIIV